jgi:glycosyltransferase involved in cell wall biosynthesis
LAVCRLVGSFPSSSSLVGGAESGRYLGPNVYALSKAQVRLGTDLHVLCRGNGTREEMEGIKVHRLRAPYHLTSLSEMLRINASAKVRIIHIHATTAYTVAVSRRLVGNASIVVHVHGTTVGASGVHYGNVFSESWTRTASIAREKFLWRRAQRLLAVSENIRDELVLGYGIDPDRVRVVHNGVDSELFSPSNRREELRQKYGWANCKVILYVGQLSPRKGLSVLIQAAYAVAQQVKDIKVVIVGGIPRYQEASTQDYVSSLQQLSGDLGLGEMVQFLGSVPNVDLPNVYSAADVFVLPSFYEGLPKVMLEAMACEKPVVATNLPGISAILTKDLGICFPAGSVERLAAALVTLLTDETARNDMGGRARAKVVNELTWDAAAKKIRDIYSEIV